jgi:putative AlgH/UPF0301 family transcriptional regulator
MLGSMDGWMDGWMEDEWMKDGWMYVCLDMNIIFGS